MMFLLTCDKKLTKSQLSPTHASTKRNNQSEQRQQKYSMHNAFCETPCKVDIRHDYGPRKLALTTEKPRPQLLLLLILATMV